MRTILLVDDNQLLVRTYSLVLRQKGYTVMEVDSGVSVLTVARRHLSALIACVITETKHSHPRHLS